MFDIEIPTNYKVITKKIEKLLKYFRRNDLVRGKYAAVIETGDLLLIFLKLFY